MGWLDYDPASPVVLFEQDDGARLPVPRERATMLGFMPAAVADAAALPAPEPPVVEAPPVPPPAPPLPQSIPEGSASAFGAGALAPRAPALAEPVFEPPAVTPPEPVIDAVSGGGPAEVPAQPHASMPGIGYVPAMVADPAHWVTPQPTGPQSMEQVDQQLADKRESMQLRGNVEDENLAFTQQKQREEEQRQFAKMQADANAAIKQAADYKVDPGRKWADMGTGRKIGVIIMAAISGLGSALKGQGDKNPALDIINAAIDQDIALQMDERANLGTQADRKRGALDQLAGMFQGREAERSARKAAIWERLGREWGEAEAAAGSQRVKFVYGDLRAQAAAKAQEEAYNTVIEEAKTVSKLEHEAAQTGKLNAETQAILRKFGSGGGSGLAGKTGTGGQYQSLDQIDPKYRDKAVRLPDGSWIVTNSRESAKEATAAVVQSTTMVDNIDRALSKITSMPGFASKLAGKAGWEGDDIQVINQEMSQLVMAAKEYYKLGVISGPDLNLIERLGADITATKSFNENQWGKLTNWRAGVTQDAASKLRAYGVDIDPGAAYGATPEKPRAQTSGEWGAQITSSPTRDSTGDILAAPNISDAEAMLRGMRESWSAEGRTDAEWQGELGSMGARVRVERNNARNRIADINEQIEKLEKKGGKGSKEKAAALRLRKIKEAAAMANYDGIAKRIDEAKKQSIQGDVKKAKAKKEAAARQERDNERTATEYRHMPK